MRGSLRGLLALVLAGSFFIFSNAFSANTDVVINEIGAYPTSTHEWVEIWNKGSAAVDLTNWIFWENNTRHGLAATGTTDSILSPGEYAAIAQKSEQFLLDHPGFGGSIFGSTWSSLSTSGEEIGLEDASGVSIERFVYQAATNFSLERKDPFTADYTSNNWQQHASGNTLGFVNSNYVPAVITTSTTGAVAASTTMPFPTTTTSTIAKSTAANTTTTVDLTSWSHIKINEFLPNPESGSEWIELYNTSSSTIDLAGGILCDNRASSCTIATLTGTILSHTFVAVFLPSGKLNNDGDSVVLKNSEGIIVDSVVYGDVNFLIPAKGQTVARRVDGVDTNSDTDFAITTAPTLGGSNVITAVPIPASSQASSSGGSSFGSQSSGGTIPSTSFFDAHRIWLSVSSSVVINELLPNPMGSDETEEFVELKNISTTPIKIDGWLLGTKDKLFTLFGNLNVGEISVWPRKQTGITLANTTSTEVRLYNQGGQIADSVVYGSAPSGQSYARSASGTWVWTASVTRGGENKIQEEQKQVIKSKKVEPVWKITVPTSGKAGNVLEFDASKSVDPRGGKLLMSWDFGDGSTLDGTIIEHAFLQPGNYVVRLSATSSMGTVGTKNFVVRIAPPNQGPLSGVVISELYIDPSGVDSEEFVEVFNASTTTVDLSGFGIQTSEEDRFVVPPATALLPQTFLVFYRLATHLDLANSGGEVNLVSASGTLFDAVMFPKAVSGKSFTRESVGWKWAAVPNPGRFALASETVPDEPPQKVLGKKIKATTKPKAKKVALAPIAVDFDDTENLVSGRPVIARGVVTAVPGALGKQYFYLSSNEGGMQIYQSKKDFPPLEVGDAVEVRGKISVAQGVKRINIANKFAVDILDTEKGLTPQEIVLDDMQEENTGALVSVAGELTEITGSQMYVDDGRGEIAVYVRQSTKINKKDFKVGQIVRVTGILEQGQKGWRLSPRSPEDLLVTGTVSAAPQEVLGKKIKDQEDSSKKYLLTGGIGVVAVGGAFLLRFLRSAKSNNSL